jgi:hypothetical protein
VSRTATTAWVVISVGLAVAAWVAVALLFWEASTFPYTQIAVAVPIAIAAVPLLPRSERGRRIARGIAAILLFACCFVGLFSVGILYVPCAIAMVVACVIGNREPQRTVQP